MLRTVAPTPRKNGSDSTVALLKWHNLHRGIYARVARHHDVDPSFVSRVANGERSSRAILRTLLAELRRISSPSAV